MVLTREPAHVHADLRDHDLGGPGVDPGNRVESHYSRSDYFDASRAFFFAISALSLYPSR